MRIITYSDLHLEFGTKFSLPKDINADLMILAGDIITFANFQPFTKFLSDWTKPVLFVTGNHEYYTNKPMQDGDSKFKFWLSEQHPNVTFLQDEAIIINGVNFFGGTMWTDFNQSNPLAMFDAVTGMNDYKLIRKGDGKPVTPSDTIDMHNVFVQKIKEWFAKPLTGPRVVITHNAPVINPKTKYKGSPLQPAFNSLDMIAIIEKHQPDLWVYGHTHECDHQWLGKTQIISNQLGYANNNGGYECPEFDSGGLVLNII